MKKGFTLIELLAVIVIVAIITLIATPIISNVVNNSKVGALKNSAYGLLEASNLYYAQNGSKGIRFDINDNIVTSNDTTKLLNYKGNIKRGTIIIDKKGNTTICITDGTNSAYKNYNDQNITTVTKETCNIPTSSYIVYLENSGATRTELSNQELTDLVATLQDRITELENSKASQTDLNTINDNIASLETQIETVGTIANSATIDKIYPVGSTYTSSSNVNPSTLLGGTWELISSNYDRQQVGTQVLYDEISGSGVVAKTNLLGAYYYSLIEGLFANIDTPSGYHQEYRLNFQGTTGGGNDITVYLNNIATNNVRTWSAGTFRSVGASKYFKLSDITLEPTMNYSINGINLKYQISGASSTWAIRNISVSGFIVSDTQLYTYKRTA